jgi:hypothetical protein
VIGPALATIRASANHLEATAINHPKATIRHPTQTHPATVPIAPAKVHPIVVSAPIGRARAIQPRNHPKTAADRANRAIALGFGRAAGNWLTVIAKTPATHPVRLVHSMAP